MDTHDPDRRLRVVSERQLGLITTADINAVQLSRTAVLEREERGELERVWRGVYRYTGYRSTHLQQLMAAVLFNGPGAVASHRSAAHLWGLPGFRGDAVLELSKPRGRNQRRRGVIEHGSLWLPPHHRTMREDIPVTTAARTIFDLAGTVHPKRAERAMENALSQGLVTQRSLQQVFDDLARRGRRGTVLMRELLEARGEGYVASNSELEALGRRVISQAGLPSPGVERNLGDAQEWMGRVDLVYLESKLVIELDSRRHHTALLDRRADRTRDNKLMADGWRVLRFTWDDLVERPQEVATQIRRALRRHAS